MDKKTLFKIKHFIIAAHIVITLPNLQHQKLLLFGCICFWHWFMASFLYYFFYSFCYPNNVKAIVVDFLALKDESEEKRYTYIHIAIYYCCNSCKSDAMYIVQYKWCILHKKGYNRSTNSAAFCALQWKSFKSHFLSIYLT